MFSSSNSIAQRPKLDSGSCMASELIISLLLLFKTWEARVEVVRSWGKPNNIHRKPELPGALRVLLRPTALFFREEDYHSALSWSCAMIPCVGIGESRWGMAPRHCFTYSAAHFPI
jgi:hypothetical protein